MGSRIWLTGIALAATMSLPKVQADYGLQITEIFGGVPGPDLTVGWFEVTNFGDMPWIQGVDPDLHYEGVPLDLRQVAAISGINDIQSGESVVVLVDNNAADTSEFINVWNPVKDLTGIEIGGTGRSGVFGNSVSLINGLDGGVHLFVGDPNTTGVLADFERIVKPETGFTGVTFDVVLGEYSTPGNESGAVATIVGNPGTVGSPGMIPEPTSIALLGLAVMLGLNRRAAFR